MRVEDITEARPSSVRYKDITRTPGFKRWFAGSKVVDKRGQPLRVFHGTTSDFDAFDMERTNGIAFFSTKPRFASGYALSSSNPGNVIPVYLRITQPFDYRVETNAASEFWQDTGGIDDRHSIWQIRVALYGKRNLDDDKNPNIHDEPLSLDEFEKALTRGKYPALESWEFLSWIRGAGYDGIVTFEGNAINFGIFNANQAKSIFAQEFTVSDKLSETR